MYKLIISIVFTTTSLTFSSCETTETKVSEEEQAQQKLEDHEKKLQEIMNESNEEH